MRDIHYRLIPARRAIRVLHLDLRESWWKRGQSTWERDAKKVENIIRAATGAQRVYRSHGRSYVEFRLRAVMYARAAVAVRLSCGAESDSRLLEF